MRNITHFSWILLESQPDLISFHHGLHLRVICYLQNIHIITISL